MKTWILAAGLAGLALPGVARAQALRWQLAVPKSIEVNATTQTWHAGRVQDVVDFADGSVVMATNGGGPWWASRDGAARPLGDTWDDPDMVALERGPDSQFHVYAATTRGLRETRSPALDAWTSIPLPPSCVPRDLAVLRGARRLLLGCNTGLFWSDVPSPDAARTYTWNAAGGTGATADVASIATKPTGFAWGAAEAATAERLTNNPNIAVVSRSPIHRDAFWVGTDGALRTAYHQRGRGWNTLTITAPGTAQPNSKIAAVARGEAHLDVFFVGPSGEVKTTWWDNANGDWRSHVYTIFPANSAAIGWGVSAIARTPGTLDLFWARGGGQIMHSAWPTGGTWSTPVEIVGTGGIAASSRIAVASRSPDVLNVFWISPLGEVKTNWWQQGNPQSWRNLYTIPGGGGAATAGGIDAIGRDGDKLDVVWVGADGRLMTTYWNRAAAEQWNGHAYPLTAPRTAATLGNVALTSRNPLQLDLFWQAADGSVRTSYWNGNTGGSFAAQTYAVGVGGARNVAATSASDEELTVYTVGADGALTAKQWTHTDGMALVGLRGTNAQPIVKGTWSGGRLTLAGQTLTGGDGRYSTARVSISKYGTAAYAIVANPMGLPDQNGNPTGSLPIKYVFRSDNLDAGTWRSTGITVTSGGTCTSMAACAGGQGADWNGTIAVSPVDNSRVYVGWVRAFSSTNGGSTWQPVLSEHVHDDQSRITFGDYDRFGKTALFSTDGGVSATFDGTTYFSRFNERVASLQCYTTDGARQSDGSLSASYQVANLIGAGLQDNGNVWALHGSTAWKRFDGGDGGYFTFVREPQALARLVLNDTVFSRWEWDGSQLVNRGAVNVTVPKPAPPGGPASPAQLKGGFVIVNSPVAWPNGGKIYGYNWSGTDVYSLWNPSGGSSWRWEYEATPALASNEGINAGGSANGQLAFFGTSAGRIFTYDRRTRRTATSRVDTSSIPNAADYGVNRMTILSDRLGYALLNRWRNTTASDPAYVLAFDGTRWAPLSLALTTGGTLSTTRFWSLDADWTVVPNTLLVATDDKVYRSTNSGASWTEESTGLPRRAHLADLRFVVFPGNVRRFYMSTFGRSVYYADVR